MLHSIKQLERCRVLGRRGTEIGSVTDTYFDDEKWVVRYLVVETGDWVHRHRVLLSPLAVTSFDGFLRALATDLSLAQIESSPGIETKKPAEGVWAARQRSAEAPKGREVDPHLRSGRHVVGYRLAARDGVIGRIEDFLFDPETWAVCYAVVHIRNLLLGKRVLISPERIRRMDASKRTVTVDVCRAAVRNSPPYTPDRWFSKTPSRRGAHPDDPPDRIDHHP